MEILPLQHAYRHAYETAVPTGRIRYQVPHFWEIIISPKSPRILRFMGPTTHRWKQEKIPQGASFPEF
jgi:hypothetical protein